MKVGLEWVAEQPMCPGVAHRQATCIEKSKVVNLMCQSKNELLAGKLWPPALRLILFIQMRTIFSRLCFLTSYDQEGLDSFLANNNKQKVPTGQKKSRSVCKLAEAETGRCNEFSARSLKLWVTSFSLKSNYSRNNFKWFT